MIARNKNVGGQALFPLGHVVATPGALKALEESGDTASQFLARHQTGDWGEVGEEDRKENELSLREGFRIMSVYHTSKGVRLWIISEHNRSVTTLLLPEDY